MDTDGNESGPDERAEARLAASAPPPSSAPSSAPSSVEGPASIADGAAPSGVDETGPWASESTGPGDALEVGHGQVAPAVSAGRPSPIAIVAAVVVVAIVAITAIGTIGLAGKSTPTPSPASPAPSPTFSFASRSIGIASAPVTIEIWADFQCPYCGLFTHAIEPSLVREEATTGRALITFHDFAFLGQESKDAAVAARCAGQQGAFWQFHDLLFASPRGENQGAFARDVLVGLAKFARLDVGSFTSCLDDPAVASAVTADTLAGRQLGISSTPSIRIVGPNGTDLIAGVADPATIDAAVERGGAPASPSPAPSGSAPASPGGSGGAAAPSASSSPPGGASPAPASPSPTQ